MTRMQFAIATCVLSFVLLGGYALGVLRGPRRVERQPGAPVFSSASSDGVS